MPTLLNALLALIATLVRCLRPSQGVHASPRRAVDVPTIARDSDPREVPVSIPAPRKPVDDELPRTLRPVPADYVPIVNPRAVQPQAAMVRPAYRRWERAQELARIDRDRLALGVLLDIAARANREGGTR